MAPSGLPVESAGCAGAGGRAPPSGASAGVRAGGAWAELGAGVASGGAAGITPDVAAMWAGSWPDGECARSSPPLLGESLAAKAATIAVPSTRPTAGRRFDQRLVPNNPSSSPSRNVERPGKFRTGEKPKLFPDRMGARGERVEELGYARGYAATLRSGGDRWQVQPFTSRRGALVRASAQPRRLTFSLFSV